MHIPDDKTFLNTVVSKDLMRRLDDYRFKNRHESRAEAVRQLLELALKVEAEKE